MEDRLLWLDLETTGLNPDQDVILEVGAIISDWYGSPLSVFHSLVESPGWREKLVANPVAEQMHIESGLIDAFAGWSAARCTETVDSDIIDWLTGEDYPSGMPICGNSVHFDKAFAARYMPRLTEFVGYRVIDISSTIEQMRVLNIGLFNKMPNLPKAHRALGDINRSITIWRWLTDNFLFTA